MYLSTLDRTHSLSSTNMRSNLPPGMLDACGTRVRTGGLMSCGLLTLELLKRLVVARALHVRSDASFVRNRDIGARTVRNTLIQSQR